MRYRAWWENRANIGKAIGLAVVIAAFVTVGTPASKTYAFTASTDQTLTITIAAPAAGSDTGASSGSSSSDTPVPGAPNTGFGGNTVAQAAKAIKHWVFGSVIGAILMGTGVTLFIWALTYKFGRKRHLYKHIGGLRITRRTVVLPAITAIVLGAVVASFSSPLLSNTYAAEDPNEPNNPVVTVTQSELDIPVQVGSSATGTSTVTFSTSSAATAWQLLARTTNTSDKIHFTINGNGLDNEILPGQDDTPLTALSGSSAQTSPLENSYTIQVSVDSDIAPGEYPVSLNYAVTTVEPTALTCNGASASNLEVDINDNLIPVTYTGTASSPEWRKANRSNWCNYDSAQWANAVAFTDTEKLATYKDAPSGTVIPEADVSAYFVYVPRYKYQVQRFSPSDPAITTPTAFNIQFEKNTTPKSLPAATGDYATHPAFSFGSTELNGMWVGKYETGRDDIDSYDEIWNGESITNFTDEAKTTGVHIKPDQLSLAGQNVSHQFATAQSLSTQYHLGAASDTRMANNKDWGAVAYLATSAYGRGTDQTWINNAILYEYTYDDVTGFETDREGAVTGRAGDSVADVPYDLDYNYLSTKADVIAATNAYYTTNGVHASTTNNVYGIYDMSGGALEYTLSTHGVPTSDSSGWGIPRPISGLDTKYYNSYNNPPFTDNDSYANYNVCAWATCGGQALYETTTVQSVSSYDQSWFGDYSLFPAAYSPWSLRGGEAGNDNNAGLFAGTLGNGSANSNNGFRAIQSAP